jgi:hypothetical protein
MSEHFVCMHVLCSQRPEKPHVNCPKPTCFAGGDAIQQGLESRSFLQEHLKVREALGERAPPFCNAAGWSQFYNDREARLRPSQKSSLVSVVFVLNFLEFRPASTTNPHSAGLVYRRNC